MEQYIDIGILRITEHITHTMDVCTTIQAIGGNVWVTDSVFYEGRYTPRAVNMHDLQDGF
jgi:hypothetical protein